MPDAGHTHAQHAAHAHASSHRQSTQGDGPRLRASWIRHSALQRLAGAAIAIALLWGAVAWALR